MYEITEKEVIGILGQRVYERDKFRSLLSPILCPYPLFCLTYFCLLDTFSLGVLLILYRKDKLLSTPSEQNISVVVGPLSVYFFVYRDPVYTRWILIRNYLCLL